MSETSEEQPRETAGLPDADEVSDEHKQDIEQEREERLDPDNRPDGTEVDNTDRDFDPETGMFTDNPDHAEAEPVFSSEDEA
jgi:hypothetical protein